MLEKYQMDNKYHRMDTERGKEVKIVKKRWEGYFHRKKSNELDDKSQRKRRVKGYRGGLRRSGDSYVH